VAGLIAFGAPNIDTLSQGPAPVQWPRENAPRFRDGKAWPEAIVGANRDAKGRATGTEGGFTIINARRIWDADPNHATISYSTDQNADDLVVLEHELKSFSIVFSMADIHRIIGPNAARFVGMADQNARSRQARRHHPPRRRSDEEHLRNADDEGRAEGRQDRCRQATGRRHAKLSASRSVMPSPMPGFENHD
jgi:hypothetical protein